MIFDYILHLLCITSILLLLNWTIFKYKSRHFAAYNDENTLLAKIGGPTPHIIVGNALPLLFRQVHELLDEYCKIYTVENVKSNSNSDTTENAGNEPTKSRKMFLIWLGYTPFLVVHDKEAVKRVLLHSSRFTKESFRSEFEKGVFANIMRPLMGNGLLTSEGKLWQIHHRLTATGFQPARYQDALPLIATKTKEMMIKWEKMAFHNGQNVDLCEEFSRLTLDNLGIAAFGEDFNAVNSDRTCIYDEVAILLTQMQNRAQQLYPIYKLYPKFMTRKFDQANEKIHEIVREKIQNRRQTIQKNQNNANQKKYLLDVLLESQSEYQLTEAEIEDEMITAVMGGHETTASLLMWTCFLLYRHPVVLEKVVQEIRSILYSDDNDHSMRFPEEIEQVRTPSVEQLHQMNYLNMVLLEVLRLYPPAPILNRVTTEDINLIGYHVPQGTQILICPWALHRDEEYWPHADQFEPERFRNSDHASSLRYLPFAAGPRACLGKTFALLEGKMVISLLLQYFTIDIVDGESKEAAKTEMTITIRPKLGRMLSVLQKRCDVGKSHTL